jgi:hypothetical protein
MLWWIKDAAHKTPWYVQGHWSNSTQMTPTASEFFSIRHTKALYKANYIPQVFTKSFIKKYFFCIARNNKTYYSWKYKAVDPLSSTTHQWFIVTLLWASNGFLKPLQQEVPLRKISIPEFKSTMKKPSVSNYLCWGERAKVPKEEEASHGPYQPMPKPHGHLMCHWLIKFLLLSNLFKSLSLLSLVNFILTTRSSIQRLFFLQQQWQSSNIWKKILKMVPTLATKWFIHAKTQEFDEGLQQYNLLVVYRLSNW